MSPGWAKPNAHCSAFLASPLAPAPGCGSRTFHQASFLLFSFVLLAGPVLASPLPTTFMELAFVGSVETRCPQPLPGLWGQKGRMLSHGPTPAISSPEDLGNSCPSLRWCLLARGSEKKLDLAPRGAVGMACQSASDSRATFRSGIFLPGETHIEGCIPMLEVLEWLSAADFLLQPAWMWLHTRGGSG